MSRLLSLSLIFGTAAVTLVLEILAGRLLAPYLGISLEVFTGIIGTVLAGLAAGAWLGGKAADHTKPEGIISVLLVGGGILAMLAPTIVRWVGPSMSAGGPFQIVTITALAFFLPTAALSAVAPIVVKLRLRDLKETGTVVGGYSAVATAGAIFGTFLTGFLLLSAWPTRPIIFALGGVVVAGGIALGAPGWRRSTTSMVVVGGALSAGLLAIVDGPCDVETAYHCANVQVDGNRPTGRYLVLDGQGVESYVDLDDPTYLDLDYVAVIADVVEATFPPGALDAIFIGRGGFTLPRYLPAIRPGSTGTVLEIDEDLVDLSVSALGLDVDTPGLRIRIGDARLLISDEPRAAFDLIVGDAFSSLAVPWHLTTEEFLREVRARLTPNGVYVLNVIDNPPLDFVRAEVATLSEVFSHVVVIARTSELAGASGGNFVLVGSDELLDGRAIEAAIAERNGSEEVLTGAAVAEFSDGATLLRDDFAPVDQLLSRD